MQERIDIVRLTAADSSMAPLIASLGEEATGVEPGPGRVNRLAEEIAGVDPEGRAIFIARVRDTLVGFSRLALGGPGGPQWWLLGLRVHPEYRRRGVATALVRACIDYARVHGATVLMSMTHPDNGASICCHESIGFEHDGRFVSANGVKQLRFRLPLG